VQRAILAAFGAALLPWNLLIGAAVILLAAFCRAAKLSNRRSSGVPAEIRAVQ
jgi:hypothetical protein